MTKKIKKRANIGREIPDPMLEEVDEDRAFEMELDEETNEIIFVHHYRHKWGDQFDADVEHALNMEQASEVVGTMISMMEQLKTNQLVFKATLEPIEGNPLRDNTVL